MAHPTDGGYAPSYREITMQRHFFAMIYNREGVYDLGNDSSQAWTRHHHSYHPATGVMPASIRSRPPLVLCLREDCTFLLISFLTSRNRAERMMELKLVVLAGAKEGTQIPLKKDKFIIGRASECTLRAGSEAISRRHCAIVRNDDKWMVRDLGSRNGTFLNDQCGRIAHAAQGRRRAARRAAQVSRRAVRQAGRRIQGGEAGRRVAAASPRRPPAAGHQSRQAAAGQGRRRRGPADRQQGRRRELRKTTFRAGCWASMPRRGDMLRETQTLSMEETTTINRPAPAKPDAAVASASSEAPPEAAERTTEADGRQMAAGSQPTRTRRAAAAGNSSRSARSRVEEEAREIAAPARRATAKTAAKRPPTSSAK